MANKPAGYGRLIDAIVRYRLGEGTADDAQLFRHIAEEIDPRTKMSCELCGRPEWEHKEIGGECPVKEIKGD